MFLLKNYFFAQKKLITVVITFPTFFASTSNTSILPLSKKFTRLSKLTLLFNANFDVLSLMPNISRLTLLSVEASDEFPVLMVILYFTFEKI